MAVDPLVWPTPRSAYIHVPFCRHRCGYCNFSVVADRDDLIARYLNAIDQEFESLNQPEVDTIFIGGGTPTHLDLDSLQQLLRMIGERFQFAEDLEFSVEANPEDINDEKLALLASHRVNRISLGVQSLDNTKLKQLERSHDGDAVCHTIQAVAAMIPNVSIDLIFASPGESVDAWQTDLDRALSMPIQHLSTYALTYEKGTSFWTRRAKGELKDADESIEIEMYAMARNLAANSGLNQYEISSFARDGYRCRHNMAYWLGSPWFGVGPGAARFVDGKRETNHRSTTTYLKRISESKSPIAESETISAELHARERVAFGVRMIDGADLDSIARATGIDINLLCRAAIDANIQDGWIEIQDNVISLTEPGILFADSVAARFLD